MIILIGRLDDSVTDRVDSGVVDWEALVVVDEVMATDAERGRVCVQLVRLVSRHTHKGREARDRTCAGRPRRTVLGWWEEAL